MTLLRNIFLILLTLTLTNCSVKRNPVPKEYAQKANIKGYETVRAHGYGKNQYFQKDLEQSLVKYLSSQGSNPKIDILALSGGGSDGAFSAGIVNGWTQSGKRPEFYLVTGISTGALVAPFAFLGEKYDQRLKEAFTTISAKDVFEINVTDAILGNSSSLASTEPLKKLIEKYLTEEVLMDIIKAHNQGRRLYIGTTNLDNQRVNIWNIGEIAIQPDKEKSLALIRKILLASASIPVAFPPVRFDVKVDDNDYDELHVDGGMMTEVFLYGFSVDFSEALNKIDYHKKIDKSLYIIRNSKIHKDYVPVDQSFLSIGTKALFTLTTSQGIGDLFRIYYLSMKDGFKYNFTYIPYSYNPISQEPFDNLEMNQLYELGYKMGKSQDYWKHSPANITF
ncbi:patatin-like phospholipase family protein [Francisella marina]|uniref:Patatin-like phospholipase family protein n=1 Tax=Francisella marina TaxID=2249302 RepID=A0ABX5ZHQ9_9GAMM|nr:patatin-like phospholipase family protein [Francisella marina]QEO56723.1 patatin-like phospholipase family protein [Francisella marina]QEO59157.1 patatin-like phospholipase family protein [Francisella marina]